MMFDLIWFYPNISFSSLTGKQIPQKYEISSIESLSLSHDLSIATISIPFSNNFQTLKKNWKS